MRLLRLEVRFQTCESGSSGDCFPNVQVPKEGNPPSRGHNIGKALKVHPEICLNCLDQGFWHPTWFFWHPCDQGCWHPGDHGFGHPKIQFCKFHRDEKYSFAGSTRISSFFFILFRGGREETSLIRSNLQQNSTPGRSGHAGSESEVENLEISHPEAKLRKPNLRCFLSDHGATLKLSQSWC